MGTRCLGTWFSGRLGNVMLMVGLDDIKGLNDSMIPNWLVKDFPVQVLESTEKLSYLVKLKINF